MTADAPLTSVDFKNDGATLAVGTTRGKYVYGQYWQLHVHRVSVEIVKRHSSDLFLSLGVPKEPKVDLTW